jgi:hypothetical protein
MGIILAGTELMPLPEGLDPMNASDWEFKYFLTPFLAHTLGTLAGAYSAALIAVNQKKTFALVIGSWFLLGGITMVFIIPAPAWFICLDLTAAYIPMGLLGWSLTK